MGAKDAKYFGVDHESPDLYKLASIQVVPEMEQGRTLFIELNEQQVNQASDGKKSKREAVARYQSFVIEAQRSGVRVVPLDSKKIFDMYARAHGKRKSERLAELARRHIMNDVRETRWKKILAGAKEGDIVIMHQTHLKQISRDLEIPTGRCRYFGTIWPSMALSASERKEFEKLRAAKRKRKRLRLNPPPELMTLKEKSQRARKKRLRRK